MSELGSDPDHLLVIGAVDFMHASKVLSDSNGSVSEVENVLRRALISNVDIGVDGQLYRDFQDSLGSRYMGTTIDSNIEQINKMGAVSPAIQEHGVKVYQSLDEQGLLRDGSVVADIGTGSGDLLLKYLSSLGNRENQYYLSEPSVLFEGLMLNIDDVVCSGNNVNLHREVVNSFLTRLESEGVKPDVITFNLVLQNLPAEHQLKVLRRCFMLLNPNNSEARIVYTLTGPGHISDGFAQIYNAVKDELGFGDFVDDYVEGMVHDPEKMRSVLDGMFGEGASSYKVITDFEMEETGIDAFERISAVQPIRLFPSDLSMLQKELFESQLRYRLIGEKLVKHSNVLAFEIVPGRVE